MHELDRSLQAIEKRVAQAHDRARRRSEPIDDDALIGGIEDRTAGPTEVAHLARILAPAVRSQLVTWAQWRSDFELLGGKLPFAPAMPMQIAVEMSSTPAEDELPDGLQSTISMLLKYRPEYWLAEKHPWLARTAYLDWVVTTVLVSAAGSSDFMSIRQSIDAWYVDDSDDEPVVHADERVLRLASPLMDPTEWNNYPLVSAMGRATP